jgi:hypothetical protein
MTILAQTGTKIKLSFSILQAKARVNAMREIRQLAIDGIDSIF